MAERVLIAMSGGVDSSVAAAILAEAGYEVIGATMQVWPSPPPGREVEGGCCSLAAVEDARRVAAVLGIPYYVLNFQDIFAREVVEPFVATYLRGATPNPCLACNMRVKFGALLYKARALGAGFLATGHYARSGFDEAKGRYFLRRGVDQGKDQSYALYGLSQEQLAASIFPLGGLTKAEVREKARALKLPVAEKGESQEICFVPDNDYAGFIREYVGDEGKARSQESGVRSQGPIEADSRQSTAGCHGNEAIKDGIQTPGEKSSCSAPPLLPCSSASFPLSPFHPGTPANALQPGPIVTKAGRVLGTHKGLAHYTVGQRKGLGVAASAPLYVIELRMATNELVVGEEAGLYRSELACADVNWIAFAPPLPEMIAAGAKIRYGAKPAAAVITPLGDKGARVRFEEPQRAITPGQAVVFYDGDEVLGGGTIGFPASATDLACR